MDKSQDIKTLKGIGDKSIKLYHKVGIYTYGDLMYYYPRDYIQYTEPVEADDSMVEKHGFFKVRILKRPELKKTFRMPVVTADVVSGSNEINSVWFNMPYLTNILKPGCTYVFGGTLKRNGYIYRLEHPLIFTCDEYDKIKNTLQPVYPLTKGLSNSSIKKAVKQVLDLNSNNDIQLQDGISEARALSVIHFPENTEELKKAREALVFNEFLLFILRIRLLKEENKKAHNDFIIRRSSEVHDLISKLPYKLTKAQSKVFEEVEADLFNETSMSRLIQGDVGCGKTIIAILACMTAALSGYQCAVMVPTEILAAQHYASFTELFTEYGFDIPVCLLTGSMSISQKKQVYSRIESGEVKIVIGTHALFQEKVIYNDLALVVTDEQHRFGVKQREFLVNKGNSSVPHVLVMSATPIPRTLAIMIYGDLDISVIDEVPARRLPVKNCVVDTGYRRKAYGFIEKEVRAGHQAYVICPLVEESEGLDLKDVLSYTKELKQSLPPDIKIACLHGRMKSRDKDRIMKAYLEGETDVLVSTTVVEVGVNVPNATVMMIENAERFGLAQLHQLRGRIGRGDAQSYCIFINGNENEHNKKRLDIIGNSNDGFYVASEDLKLRGPGDMFGVRQSGEMQFRLADIYNDINILKKAAKKADEILALDPLLEHKENSYLKKRLDELAHVSDIHAL